MRCFFIDAPLTELFTIQGRDARHINRVLRLAPGAELIVVGSGGKAGRARIISAGLDSVSLRLEEILGVRNEPPVEVRLAQGLPKSDKMEYVVQKAVEVGAAGIIPMAVDFCTVSYDEAKKKARVERWRKIAGEAAKQCGRNVVPTVTPVQGLDELFSGVDPDTLVIMLYEGKAGESLKSILADSQASSFLLLVGPEGGFSPAEAAFCREKGARIATMGPRILRTETAAVAALSILLYEKGDLGGRRLGKWKRW